MTQSLYDDPAFFAGYSQLRRSQEGLDGAPEWPVLQAMLPDLRGLRIVDLGCGFGWFCRWAASQGAARVLGLDLSEAMLARARSFAADERVVYAQADLARLTLPGGGFDLAYSSLALHYVADVGRLFAEVHRALAPGGWFVFSTEHPVFMAPSKPGWVLDAAGRRTWPVDDYAMEGPRVTEWFVPGVVKHHRMMGTTINGLIAAGFAIRQVEEFFPTPTQIAERPELAEECHRPMFLMVSAQRP
jgi:SAM-dependent methyltransferase